MSNFRRAAALLALSIALSLSSRVAVAQTGDIVDVAAANKEFSTLVAAVKAAGLVETLKGKGPFTVFAPTDDAFKKLPAGTLDKLLKPENKKVLTQILTFHVLPGKYDAARLTRPKAKQFGVKSVEGENLEFDIRKGVKVSGATVIKTDVAASNGIIHAIDTVMLPRSAKRALAGKPASGRKQ